MGGRTRLRRKGRERRRECVIERRERGSKGERKYILEEKENYEE